MSQSSPTPMMKQYFKIKEQYPDAFLFFRLGDFYELFYEDAKEAARILEITLTARNKNADNPIPMCGVPHHSSKDYIKKLVEEGHKVAICEQLEDPRTTKGMVKRDVIQVITPGTIMEEGATQANENNYLATVTESENGYILSYVDFSTGETNLTHMNSIDQLLQEIETIQPTELVYKDNATDHLIDALKTIKSVYLSSMDSTISKSTDPLWELEQATEEEAINLNVLFDYLQSVQKQAFYHMRPVTRYQLKDYLQMSLQTKIQLELTRSLRTHRRKGSLLWLIDKTKTAMGGRLLHQWLEKPLIDKKELTTRHEKVSVLLENFFYRHDLVSFLNHIYDLERLVTKISLGSANARDLDQLRFSLQQIPLINQILDDLNEQVGHTVFDRLNPLSDLYELLEETLVDDPPISTTQGDLIKDGVSDKLDKYRDALKNGQQWLLDLQQREREKTGLSTLKVGYNRVFGYYIEISRKQSELLEDDVYERKQTLANTERFITQELKDIEKVMLEADEKSIALEYELFAELRQQVMPYIEELQFVAQQIAQMDVLCNFATISEEENYVRATLVSHDEGLILKDSRHPVVERLLGKAHFVPNDVTITSQQPLLLLTGPNMSGKSTYMRQVAFCIILNQMGCFVPASQAQLPIVDQIYTRLGSSDDTASGQSTFMVEMMETNEAIRHATSNSLLLFDEIGRGTATYDGMALAEAILYYIAEKVQAATIFSTHYHELTDLDQKISSLRNIHVGAIEENNQVIFQHKILDGPADKSYGIHVARLAGLPEEVLQRSESVLETLEASSYPSRKNDQGIISQVQELDTPKQMSLFTVEENPNLEKLQQEIETISLLNLTPLQAMQYIEQWQQMLK
ncbi:DNA mismatch repair protein MutS [Dolosicoccus paucivorans]|uniref:DNA mismatch repair protein MutS n=1 Tax=Dolosicoccus paucivorans TaxID=84521 RepID=A0A2N6SPC2_9LACT|nr:DNA mismatch repair protein MutS [Dolosicoccus paucivorans]PMB85100.1 DNA mismatch repair protein MutS [Dolosicoccus paucivorans]PMC58902.1 DNA mismatch repair protein MutS [Dolosicoccus paucivorans]